MSKVSISGDQNGTGDFTIKAPNSNVDRTLTLPDEAGTVATIENIPPGYEDQDALDLFNVTGSAPVYACRAWVNFDGFTNLIREVGNVSSMTDNGPGDYTVNFNTAFVDANYCINVTAQSSFNGAVTIASIYGSSTYNQLTTTKARLLFTTSDESAHDPDVVSVAVFR